MVAIIDGATVRMGTVKADVVIRVGDQWMIFQIKKLSSYKFSNQKTFNLWWRLFAKWYSAMRGAFEMARCSVSFSGATPDVFGYPDWGQVPILGLFLPGAYYQVSMRRPLETGKPSYLEGLWGRMGRQITLFANFLGISNDAIYWNSSWVVSCVHWLCQIRFQKIQVDSATQRPGAKNNWSRIPTKRATAWQPLGQVLQQQCHHHRLEKHSLPFPSLLVAELSWIHDPSVCCSIASTTMSLSEFLPSILDIKWFHYLLVHMPMRAKIPFCSICKLLTFCYHKPRTLAGFCCAGFMSSRPMVPWLYLADPCGRGPEIHFISSDCKWRWLLETIKVFNGNIFSSRHRNNTILVVDFF